MVGQYPPSLLNLALNHDNNNGINSGGDGSRSIVIPVAGITTTNLYNMYFQALLEVFYTYYLIALL